MKQRNSRLVLIIRGYINLGCVSDGKSHTEPKRMLLIHNDVKWQQLYMLEKCMHDFFWVKNA